MPIVYDRWNTIYVGGRKGRKFEIGFSPQSKEKPWRIHSGRCNGVYAQNLLNLLFFAAGKNWIETHLIDSYQTEVMRALDQAFDEPAEEDADR